MVTPVTHVPLIRMEPIKSFFGSKDNDYQTPLFVLGCFNLIANRAKNALGYDWSHVIDFGKIGGELSNLPAYWALGTSLRSFKQSIVELVSNDNIQNGDVEEGGLRLLSKRLQKVALNVFVTISNGATFVGTLFSVDALEGLPIKHIGFSGNLCGVFYFTHLLYKQIQSLKTDPEGIDTLKNAEAKEIYRSQDQSKKWLGTIGVASLVFLKVVALNYVASTLGSPIIIPELVSRTKDLKLAFFAGWAVTYFAQHFFEEQMKAFKDTNQMVIG